MTKLLEALTELALEATKYLRNQNRDVAPAPAAAPAKSLSTDVGPAAKKSHKKKSAEAPAPAAQTQSPAAPPAPAPAPTPTPAPALPPTGLGIGDGVPSAPAPQAPTMTEAESLTETYKQGAAYIQRTPEQGQMVARQLYAKAHMMAKWKTESIKDIPHTGRIEFIAWLKDAPTDPTTAKAAA